MAFITLMDDCQDWLQQNWPPDQMAQFHRFRDRCEQLPLECADDRDGTLASFGGCAAVVPPLGCAIDLSTVHPAMIPVGTLVSDLCPVSCDACPAAGEGSAYPGCGRNSNGVGVIDSGQIAYSAADMPDVAGIRIADPQWRRAWNVVDCRWVLQCTDDTLVPRVTFSAFATEVGHDYVRAWDGRLPNADRIADLHGSDLPDAVVGFGTVMTLQYVSDGSDDRFSQGDHFSASFDCIAGNPDAVPPADTYRCAMEFHSLVEVFLSGKRPSAMNLDADCGRRHKGSHLVSIHSAEDQAQLASITQANNVPSVWIGLNDIESGKRAPDAAVIPTC